MKTNTNYSIEFGHIYVDETYSHEHELGAHKALELIEEYKAQDKSYSVNLLIDDYNPEESLLDVEALVNKHQEFGIPPNFIAGEAGLAAYKDDLFDLITNNKIKKNYSRYIQGKNGKIPCSFMVAVWYLIRLGVIPLRKEDPIVYNGYDSELLVSERLVNILPERFKGVEDQAIKIIKGTRESQAADKIEWVYLRLTEDVVSVNTTKRSV